MSRKRSIEGLRRPASLTGRSSRSSWVVPLAIALGFLGAADAAVSQGRPTPDTYVATTTDMTPAGIRLKIDVMKWSDESARAAVLSALADPSAEGSSLVDLPTVGYVWPSDSGAGYALKYAYRTMTEGGGERITLVTDRPVGAYSFEPWKAEHATATEAYGYSVIELEVGGEAGGVGTMSLAADVSFDQDSQTVSLDRGDTTPNVLSDVRLEPKPYWAKGG